MTGPTMKIDGGREGGHAEHVVGILWPSGPGEFTLNSHEWGGGV